MQRYKNEQGDSGVVAYEIKPHAIVVQFQDGMKYEYTEASAGAHTVTTMKRLALTGRGLSSFISRTARQTYARKFH